MNYSSAIVVFAAMTFWWGLDARPDDFIAYSVREAERRVVAAEGPLLVLKTLGGITHLAGAVYDPQLDDIIIVGRHVEGDPPITLDDLVVAMRAVFIHRESPLVSIDRTPDTESTEKQLVRYEGGIENTQLGKDMFEADLLLKKLALGKESGELWGVESYVKKSTSDAINLDAEDRCFSRFWFENVRPPLAVRDDVFAVLGLDFHIKTEVLGAVIDGAAVKDTATLRDEVGEQFAKEVEASFSDLAAQYPPLARVKPILALVAVVSGIHELEAKPSMRFWLERYQVAAVSTPKEQDLLTARRTIENRQVVLTFNGGIRLNPLVIRLRNGEVSALKEAVLGSRPSSRALAWHPQLDGWHIPGVENMAASEDIFAGLKRGEGFSLERISTRKGVPAVLDYSILAGPISGALPEFQLQSRLPSQNFSPNIGGVMLSGTAKVEGAERAEVSLTGGNFALVVDGKDARLDPKLFRKFVTALWCVYYGQQAPGISIDPIGPMRPDMEKHLVRYIGRVINTDLGRVMREADYLMKKWAVGTLRPDYPGFRPVDGWMARFGADQSGVSRRFWFVPEQLQFKRGGDLLLFANGHMRLNTEYDVDGMRGRAGKADEQFAQFFTQHYSKLAEKYPIYAELFEYAKLVALAQYLKENGVPLHWFLLAHKDLVLTEDSPGTVDQIAKDSDYFRGMTLMGGVDLEPDSQYVYDQEAVDAIRKVVDAQHAGKGSSPAAARGAQQAMLVHPVAIEAGRQSYTLLPQHTLTSGKDHRGIRYQTDLALRTSGQPGLELVRYFNPRQRESGHFGRGWHLLIPYRVEPADRQTRPFLNAMIPERMAVVNVLGGTREVFAFSPDRYAAAGYVPERVGDSQVVGLFLMSDASFRLADKLGNQFHFDAAGRMTAMFLSPSPEHRMNIEYLDRFTGAFIEPPYAARPAGDGWVDFLNARVPARIEVRDRVNGHDEVFTFRAGGDVSGYVPNDAKTSRFRIAALLTNGGLEIVDVHGNRIRLNGAWDFDSILPSPERQMVRNVSMGDRRITFGYTLDGEGRVVIATAAVSEDKPHADSTWVVRYEYDDGGRLCRVRPPSDSPRPMLSALYR